QTAKPWHSVSVDSKKQWRLRNPERRRAAERERAARRRASGDASYFRYEQTLRRRRGRSEWQQVLREGAGRQAGLTIANGGGPGDRGYVRWGMEGDGELQSRDLNGNEGRARGISAQSEEEARELGASRGAHPQYLPIYPLRGPSESRPQQDPCRGVSQDDVA